MKGIRTYDRSSFLLTAAFLGWLVLDGLSALYPFASQTGTGRETGPFGPPFGLTARPAARMGADKGRA